MSDIERTEIPPLPECTDKRTPPTVQLSPEMLDKTYGTADWYREKFPGFEDENYRVLELMTWTDLTYSEIKRFMKKNAKKNNKKR